MKGRKISKRKRAIKSAPKDPLGISASTKLRKVKRESLDEASSSSCGNEVVYAEVFQLGTEGGILPAEVAIPDNVIIPNEDSLPDKVTIPEPSYSSDILKDSTNSNLSSTTDSFKESTKTELFSAADCLKSELSPESDSLKDFTKSELPPVINVKGSIKSELLPPVIIIKGTTKSELPFAFVKDDPKSEPNSPTDQTQGITPNEYVVFCDEMRDRIMTRHPKAKPKDAGELLSLLKAEWHEIKYRDKTHLQLKPMPYRIKVMRSAKNCIVRLEKVNSSTLKEFEDLSYEMRKTNDPEPISFENYEQQECHFRSAMPTSSSVHSSRVGRLLKKRSRADDMLYYQSDLSSSTRVSSTSSVRCPPRGRAGKRREKIDYSGFFNPMPGSPVTPTPCDNPGIIPNIPQKKTKSVSVKKIKVPTVIKAIENVISECHIIKNIPAQNQQPPILTSLLEAHKNDVSFISANQNPVSFVSANQNPTSFVSANQNPASFVSANQNPPHPNHGNDTDAPKHTKVPNHTKAISSYNKPTITNPVENPPSADESSTEKPKRKYRKRNKAADVIDLAYKALVKEEDECDMIGNLVTVKLRNMMKTNPTMKILAEKLINETIFEAEMGTLTPYHSIIIDNSQSFASNVDQNSLTYPCNFDQNVQNFPFNVNQHPPPPCPPSSCPPPACPPPACTPSASQNHSVAHSNISQTPPAVSFNFNQNLSYYSPPTTDHSRIPPRNSDRTNNFLSL